MRLNIDFTTHQSLGNVNDDNSIDNYKDFENAKALLKSDKEAIRNSIIEGFENLGIELTKDTQITIPVGHYTNSGFINSLEFLVTDFDENEVNISLINVINKIK